MGSSLGAIPSDVDGGTVRRRAIADYGLIGDCHSAALVGCDGSIDWCCFHRMDAAPVFARLLDRRGGGFCQIAPAGSYRTSRRYRPCTNILETTFHCATGSVVVRDCFGMDDRAGHPLHQLIRTVSCIDGRVEVLCEFVPRFDYGRTVPRFDRIDGELGVAYAGSDALTVQSDLGLEQVGECSARGSRTLVAGQDAHVVITYSVPHELEPSRQSRAETARRVTCAEQFWLRWAQRCKYEGPYRDAVVRAALVLKALTNSPTGAIVAAPTTSLPEEIGGSRNWDYRYAWLRDAALNLYALFRLGYSDEAEAFMRWVERTTAGRADDLQVLYGIGGERFVPEVEIAELEGFKGSRPVRIGNAAHEQFQLDVYGYLLDTAWLYHRHGGDITDAFWELLEGCVAVVQRRWTLPDDGIWEVRGGRRHFVSSKVFAWVAVDRAIRLARKTHRNAPIDRWKQLRAEVRRTVLREGVDPGSGNFVRSFGESAIDASTLLLPLIRFLPADDERIAATVHRVMEELMADGLVHRYVDRDDGLPGVEGAFVACTFWLVDVLAMMGRPRDARALFESTLARANDLGLLSEEINPATGELLGNFPQAFSHAALIGAALNLAEATLSPNEGGSIP